MDQLRGPTIQIILHVKEGIGFGFLKAPFIVSGSLNGYVLETDPTVPCHAPVFDAELVWEADKRRFRSLRIQNVPIKVEVFTTGTQGRKSKVGYLLLSLLSAQPCPSSKMVELKYSWHRLLGVKSEGKCCQPQLLMSLSIEDRINTLTPRNELRMFHSNEVAYPSSYPYTNPPTGRSVLMTLSEYIAESKRTVSSPELQPKLICDEGLIQIGEGKQLLTLSFVIGTVENVDLLLSEHKPDPTDCYIAYSIFTHNVMTDRVSISRRWEGEGGVAAFNQRTWLRLRTDLAALRRYFGECPHIVTRLCATEMEIGICSMDLRKLIPTDDLEEFVKSFCNEDKALTIHERCFLLRCDENALPRTDNRRAFVDIEMSLKYMGDKQDNVQKWHPLSARSVPHVAYGGGEAEAQAQAGGREAELEGRYSGPGPGPVRTASCTHLPAHLQPNQGYTAMALTNTARFKTATGDSMLQTNELTDLIKKMYESFTVSQEKLLLHTAKPTTSDVEIQCNTDVKEKNNNETYVKKSSDIDNQDNITGTKNNNSNMEQQNNFTNSKKSSNVDQGNVFQTMNLGETPKNGCQVRKNEVCFDRDGSVTVRQRYDDDNNNNKYGKNLEETISMRQKDDEFNKTYEKNVDGDPKSLSSRSDSCIRNNGHNQPKASDVISSVMSASERAALMQKVVDELEDWKERQQEMFNVQLKRKEEYHLELLAQAWNKKRSELETKLNRGIEQCRTLAADLSRATEDFRLRGYRNTERERKLLDAKKALETHFTAKYQELREASQKMEDEMNRALQRKDMEIERLQAKLTAAEKEVEELKKTLKNNEKEAEHKYSGLTKDQTASLIQELRCLEEKLDSALQSKAFFKEQWGRAVRELHVLKLGTRRNMLTTLRAQRRQLGLEDTEDVPPTQSQVDLDKLKDDFYVDILASSPAPVESHSMISSSRPEEMEMYEELKISSSKNPLNDKLLELISQRDTLIHQDNPNEEVLKQLNNEIRSILLNCG